MSDSNVPPKIPAPPLGTPPPSGCLTAFLVAVGILLLLPGVCSLVVGVGSHFEAGLMPFIVPGLLAGAVGALMIWAAIQQRKP